MGSPGYGHLAGLPGGLVGSPPHQPLLDAPGMVKHLGQHPAGEVLGQAVLRGGAGPGLGHLLLADVVADSLAACRFLQAAHLADSFHAAGQKGQDLAVQAVDLVAG